MIFMASGMITVYSPGLFKELDMELIISFISGLIFAMGLIISQMIDPQKLIGFLDILGPVGSIFGFLF